MCLRRMTTASCLIGVCLVTGITVNGYGSVQFRQRRMREHLTFVMKYSVELRCPVPYYSIDLKMKNQN